MNPDVMFGVLPDALLRIAEEIKAAGGRSFLVGGWVRDWLLAERQAPKDCKDYDVEVYGLDEADLVGILSHHGKPNLVGKAFGVYHLFRKGISYDFSFPRTESKTGIGHRGFQVQPHKDLTFHEAALRRDFTINAMGVELPDLRLEDPHAGQQDLSARVLRHVGPAFGEDPLRAMRAVQFAARFQLSVVPETVEICRQQDLSELSRERIWEEMQKWLLRSTQPSIGWKWFLRMELGRFFPPLYSSDALDGSEVGDALDGVAQSKDVHGEARLMVLLAALCHRAPSGATPFLESVTNEVRLLRQIPTLLAALVVMRETVGSGAAPSDTDLRIWSTKVSLRHLFLLASATRRVTGSPQYLDVTQKCDAWLLRAVALGIADKAPTPLIAGKDLLAMGMRPGPDVGVLLEQVYQEQLQGRLDSKELAASWVAARLTSSDRG